MSVLPSGSRDLSQRQEPSLLLVGTDHRSSPVELREKVSFSGAEAEEMLVHLLARAEVAEAYLLSTCNRTEVYVKPREGEDAYQTVLGQVFESRAPEITEPGRLYVKHDGQAARHLMAVASGLQSMVLGEPEILGQVRQASALAEAVGASGTTLSRLLKAAISAGGRARQETGITEGAVSLGYAVVELARQIFKGLEETRVLLIGAGEIARSVSRNLLERGARNLTVANRSPERAAAFLTDFSGAVAVPFEHRVEAAREADLVVASTGADEPILSRADLARVMHRRTSHPLLVVDLGVPRNVEPEAGKVGNLFLHDIDTLQSLIERNLKRRREAIPQVQEILVEELDRFYKWHRGLAVEPVIARLQKQAEAIRRRELANVQSRFPEDLHDELDRLTRSLVRKILHHPSTRLRSGDGHDPLPRLDLVRELFQLDDENE